MIAPRSLGASTARIARATSKGIGPGATGSRLEAEGMSQTGAGASFNRSSRTSAPADVACTRRKSEARWA
jgi:hypothetical protein